MSVKIDQSSAYFRRITLKYRYIITKNGATKVQINSAKQGTGIIAGGVVRDVMHVAGISDIVSKIIGSSSPHNTIYATFNALKQLHSVESIAARLGKTAKEIRSRYFFKKI